MWNDRNDSLAYSEGTSYALLTLRHTNRKLRYTNESHLLIVAHTCNYFSKYAIFNTFYKLILHHLALLFIAMLTEKKKYIKLRVLFILLGVEKREIQTANERK
jgi:hypothetical protein